MLSRRMEIYWNSRNYWFNHIILIMHYRLLILSGANTIFINTYWNIFLLNSDQVCQNRGAVHWGCLLPVHGHALPGKHSDQKGDCHPHLLYLYCNLVTGEVQYKTRARVHQQLQSSSSVFQENVRWQDCSCGQACERKVSGQLRVSSGSFWNTWKFFD